MNETLKELQRCMVRYNKLTTRERSADAWAALECRMWNARADALRAGSLIRGSQDYIMFSDRLNDVGQLRQYHRQLEQLN